MKNGPCRLKVTGAYRYSRNAGRYAWEGFGEAPASESGRYKCRRYKCLLGASLTGPEVRTLVSKWDLALYGGAGGKHFAEHREYFGDAERLL